MGQQHSKEGINLKQTETNLHWVLNENVKWSERASSAKLLLEGSGLGNSSGGSGGHLEEQSRLVLQEIDRLLEPGVNSTAAAPHKPSLTQQLIGASAGASSSSGSGAPSPSHHSFGDASSDGHYGAGSNTDIFDCEKPVALPLSHPAHQLMASQFFGAAATKDIILAHNASNAQSSSGHDERQLSEWTRGRLERVNTASRLDAPLGAGLGGSGYASTAGSSAGSSASNSPRLSGVGGSGSECPVHGQSAAASSNPHLSLSGRSDAPLHDAHSSGHGVRAQMDSFGRITHRDNYTAPTLYDTLPSAGGGSTYPQGTGLAGVPSSASSMLSQMHTQPPPQTPGYTVDDLSAQMAQKRQSASATKERVELVTKYLFIDALLDKMIASAQTSYQLSLQLESLRKRLKPKRTKGLTRDQISELHRQQDEKRLLLRDNQELFNKSRLTLQWFYTDYNLCYCLHLLHDVEVATRQMRDRAHSSLFGVSTDADNSQQYADQQGSGYQTAYDGSDPELAGRLDRTLSGIETRRSRVELALQANERTALSIAHYYLSRHSNGAGLRINDAPDLPSVYFAMLDGQGAGSVSREQLQAALCRLAETLDSLNARIRALQMHNESLSDGSVAASGSSLASGGIGGGNVGSAASGGQSSNMLAANVAKIAKLQSEQESTSRALREVNNYFLHTFVRNVFVNLDQPNAPASASASAALAPGSATDAPVQVASANIDPRGLLTDLGAIDAQKRQVLNPLDLANEGRVGPDENLASQVGTGLAPERVATEIEAKPGVGHAHQAALPQQQHLQQQHPVGTGISGGLAPIEEKHLHPVASRTAISENQPAVLASQPSSSQLSVLPAGGVDAAATPLADLPSQQQQLQQPIPLQQAGVLEPSLQQQQQPDLSLLSRTRKPLPTPPNSRNESSPPASLGNVATNASLAPVLHAAELRDQSGQLHHVGSDQVRPSIYGGQHDRQMAPAALAGAPADLPVNAALAPVVAPAALARQSHSLTHVPLKEENYTEFGGISMHPGQYATAEQGQQQQAPTSNPHWSESSNPAVLKQAITEGILPSSSSSAPSSASAPTNAVLAETISERDLRWQKRGLDHVAPGVETEFGGVHAHNASLPVMRSALQDQAQHLHHVPIERAPVSASGGVHMLAKKQADTGLVPEQAYMPGMASNAALAPAIQPTELVAQKKSLDAVTGVQPSQYGGVHNEGAQLGGLVDRVALQYVKAHELTHVPIEKAPVTASGGIHLIAKQPSSAALIPDMVAPSTDVASNAALAQTIRPAALVAHKRELETVTGVQPSQYGGVHADGAQLGGLVDRVALQYVKAHELAHVPIDKAAVTSSGGVHMIAKPVESTPMPEEINSVLPNNAALAPSIRPAELLAQKKSLDAVEGVQPSQYGGLHSEGAQTGVAVDRVALQYVKEHELRHVPIDSAPVTASGGIHLLGQPSDTRIVPEQAHTDSGAPNNAALAALAIQPHQLRYEKRALEHVPIELQRTTVSGGVHMNDESARVQLSLMDRVKSVLGMETAADHIEPAPGLGRVVDAPSSSSSTSSSVKQTDLAAGPVGAVEANSSGSAPLIGARGASQQGEVSLAQNAVLAPLVTPSDLAAEHSALTAPVSANKVLAPLVRPTDLAAERTRLHHVNIDRVEMRRDLAAGVGSVTTRRATPKSARQGQQQGSGGAFAFDQEQIRQSGDASSSSAPSSAVPSPRTRLPTVTGRSGAAASASNSPRQPLPAAEQGYVPIPSGLHSAEKGATGGLGDKALPLLPAEDALTKELWGAPGQEQVRDGGKTIDSALAREQFVSLDRPAHQSMQQ